MTGFQDPSLGALHQSSCLVLGGSGFIGLNLCRALRHRAASVKAFSRRPIPLDGVEAIEGNFLVKEEIHRAVRGVDVVFHLISTTTPASSNSRIESDASENIIASIQLLEACRHSSVKKVVFASSGGTVYGECSEFPTTELHPTNPISAYGISKLAIEKYMALFERLYGIVGMVLRVSNPYGPHQTGQQKQGLIGTIIRKVLTGEVVEIWGDGSVVRDYLFVDDVVNAFELAATYQGIARVLNIGSGVGVSIREVIELVGAGVATRPIVRFSPARPVDVSRITLDCSAAKEQLGWTPATSLEAGIGKTAVWFRELARTKG